MGVPLRSAFSFGSDVTWQVKPHCPRWWCSDRGKSQSQQQTALKVLWDLPMHPLCSTYFLSCWTKGIFVRLCVHYGYYQGIFAVFMPEGMRTISRSVTVRAPELSMWVCVFLSVWLQVFEAVCFYVCVWEYVYLYWLWPGSVSGSREISLPTTPSHPPDYHHNLRSAALVLHQPFPLCPTSPKSYPWLVKRRRGKGRSYSTARVGSRDTQAQSQARLQI